MTSLAVLRSSLGVVAPFEPLDHIIGSVPVALLTSSKLLPLGPVVFFNAEQLQLEQLRGEKRSDWNRPIVKT